MKYNYIIIIILIFTLFGCGKSSEVPVAPEVDIDTPTEETPVLTEELVDENIVELEELETTASTDEEEQVVTELEEVESGINNPANP
ncbi:MAG TPA: hypothetical protein VJB89_04185 [Candidatus Nanoarchaeia archaeon]|nr:hypothetical protein [Candidatus Nanoarchaeia archaeon]